MTPTEQARRGYDATGRRAQAAATRQRVLECARDLFVAQGYAGTSIAQIAKEAGVSAPTVFAGFKSKVNLLRAAVETAIVGDDEPVPLADRPAMRALHAAPTATEVLERYATMIVDIAPRACPIALVAYAAADADPEIAALADLLDEQRLRGSAAIARTIADRLGADTAREADIRDTVWTFNAPLLYGLLVERRGWSVERYGDWVRRGLLALAT